MTSGRLTKVSRRSRINIFALSERIVRFLFPLENDRWLSVLRIGLGCQVAAYCLSFAPDWYLFFARSGEGLVGRELSETMVSTQSALIPQLSWLVEFGESFGLSEHSALSTIWFLLFVGGCLLTLGLFSRAAAILAWFLHLCAAKSGFFLSYGVDNFMTIGLFYLMLSPLPDSCALDRRIFQCSISCPEFLGFFRRVLQFHLCTIYFFGGLTKALGAGWWNGASIWRALTRPAFIIISPDVLIRARYVLPIVGISVVLIELGYAVLIWPRATRRLWLVLICAMHLGIGLTMGMYLFALVMIVLNVAAFGPAEQTRALAD